MTTSIAKRKTYVVSIPFVFLLLAFAAGCSDNSQLKMGEEVFAGQCINCHAAGLNGAPIFGNAKMWGPRIEQGLPTLIEHAINGYQLMPERGGDLDLTDEQIAAAVTYMVDQIQ